MTLSRDDTYKLTVHINTAADGLDGTARALAAGDAATASRELGDTARAFRELASTINEL